jgi:DNA repair exonuclease SbcCD ATPase subunit
MRPTNLILFAIAISLAACTPSAKHEDHNHEAASTDNPNQALYDQVMDIHDEVMPRSEDIYTLKKELQEKVASATDLVTEKKQELESVISQLDSADKSMMDWMHNFRPLPDSADQEKARAYLESEMERIKKVRDFTYETIEKAKAVKN